MSDLLSDRFSDLLLHIGSQFGSNININSQETYEAIWETSESVMKGAKSQTARTGEELTGVYAYAQVSNPLAAICNNDDYNRSTRLLAATTLRNVLGTKVTKEKKDKKTKKN